MFKKFDYNGGRTFVVGDIHGQFTLMLDKLEQIGFDPFTDHLFSVGDLVDRGPHSQMACHYLSQPWFHAVRGNHEQMCLDAGGTFWHSQNGGDWWHELTPQEQDRFCAAFEDMPLFIQFESPSGRQIGIVHAAFPHYARKDNLFLTDWNKRDEVALKEDYYGNRDVLWDRDQIGRAKKIVPKAHKVKDKALREFNIKNIDHVYFGHTPIKQPVTIGNCSWIDTGAFATGNLTIEEVL